MKLIVDGPKTAAYNMAFDEVLLQDTQELWLRFYQWKPAAFSLGFFQDYPESLPKCDGQALDVVRRLTGGGAILHAHELTYSLVGSDQSPLFAGDVNASYQIVHDAILGLLNREDVQAAYPQDAPSILKHKERPFLCFARLTALDLQIDGRKLLGSAKRRRAGRSLQHGSLILGHHPLGGETAALRDHLSPAACQEFLARFPQDLGAILAKLNGSKLLEFAPDQHLVTQAESRVKASYGRKDWTRSPKLARKKASD